MAKLSQIECMLADGIEYLDIAVSRVNHCERGVKLDVGGQD